MGGSGDDALPLWRTDVETALSEARALGKMAIVDAGADWCTACHELERRTFTDPAVQAAILDMILIHVDMTAFDQAQERMANLGIPIAALPWVGFFLPDGRLNPGVTLTDFEGPSAFLRRVARADTYQAETLSPVALWLGERGLLVALLLVFVAGIGVSLTPCVYPMIPITISVVGRRDHGEGEGGLASRAGRSALFVAGMVAMYTLLGVGSAILGKGFGSWLQHPAVSIAMAVLFAALALSYLGFFALDLPSGMKTWMASPRGGRIGVVLVGAFTGIVAAPCAGPVVVGILAVISKTGDVGLGTMLMATFGLGMSVLFFALGLSTALLSKLPRKGAWMERVELLFALALLVIALYYLALGLRA